MKKYTPYAIPMILWLLVIHTIFFFMSDKAINALTEEDGPIEWAGALALLTAGVLLFIVYYKDKRSNNFFLFKTRKNIFYLLLGLFFVLGFLEEISWGQRVFGFATPKAIAAANDQGEANLHNLRIFYSEEGVGRYLNSNKLLTLFCIAYCCLLPLMYTINTTVKKFLDKINLPIPPLFVSCLFVLSLIISHSVEPFVREVVSQPLIEIKETNSYLIFLLLSIWFLRTSAVSGLSSAEQITTS